MHAKQPLLCFSQIQVLLRFSEPQPTSQDQVVLDHQTEDRDKIFA